MKLAITRPPAVDSSARRLTALIVLMNLLATVQVVWFYTNRIPTLLQLRAYELGHERMPFQGRLLMRYPLLWAHGSPAMNALAHHLTRMWALFPAGVRPEGILEAAVNLVCLLIAGLVARDLYCLYSGRGLLRAFVYPLVLAMVVVTYCIQNMHFFRYVYDFPSLALFSCGVYLVAHRRSRILFGVLFAVATLNRETSLFLLFFFAVACCCEAGGRFQWRRVLRPDNAATLLVLSIFWAGWHLWVVHHYAGLVSESKPRLLSNVATLLWPGAWPQAAGVGAYLLPFLLLNRRFLPSLELRMWLWVLPPWIAFMLFYGLLIEVRLFGELIPVMACGCVLAAEQWLLRQANLSETHQDREQPSLVAA